MFPGMLSPAMVTRTVRVGPDLAVTIATPNTNFRALVTGPRVLASQASDESPRAGAARSHLYYETSALTPAPSLLAGDRVTWRGAEFELVSQPREMRLGLEVKGYQADVLAPAALWPLTADLRDQGSSTTIETVDFAVWDAGERAAGHGQYEDLSGEAPIDFYAALSEPNRVLVSGGVTLRIVSVAKHVQGPHCALRLRRAG